MSQEFKVGDRVRHATAGEGTIRDILPGDVSPYRVRRDNGTWFFARHLELIESSLSSKVADLERELKMKDNQLEELTKAKEYAEMQSISWKAAVDALKRELDSIKRNGYYRSNEDLASSDFLLRTNAAVVWPVLEEYIKILREQPHLRGSQEDFAADLEQRMANPENYPPNKPADDGKRYTLTGQGMVYRKLGGEWQVKNANGWQDAYYQDDGRYSEIRPEDDGYVYWTPETSYLGLRHRRKAGFPGHNLEVEYANGGTWGPCLSPERHRES